MGSLENVVKGVLHFHSETGTEGGDWAFQDDRYIGLATPSHGASSHQTVYDLNNPKRKGKVRGNVEVFLNGTWLPSPDPMTQDPDYDISSLFCGERRGDLEADKRLMSKYGFTIRYARERMDEQFGEGNWQLEDPSTAITPDGKRWIYGGTPTTDPQRPYGIPYKALTRGSVAWDDGVVDLRRLSDTLLVPRWSYEGLHILEEGDELTIYHPKSNQEVWSGTIDLKHYNVFTEHASGWWIHADQKGIERDTWAEYFFKEFPARLITKGHRTE